MTFSRRDFLRLAGLAGLAWATPGSSHCLRKLGFALRSADGPVLRLLAAGRRLPEVELAAFSAAAGLSIHLIAAGDALDLAGADLALAPAHRLPGLIESGQVQELSDAAGQPSAGQRPYDPYAVFSRLAGRGAIGINSLDGPAPAAWAEFFELARTVPAHLPPAEALGAALISLGESINTRDSLARRRAAGLLAGLTKYPLETARLAVGAQRPGWQFRVPAEGAELWEDCWCLPALSARPAEALALVNFAAAYQPPLPVGRLEPRSAYGLI